MKIFSCLGAFIILILAILGFFAFASGDVQAAEAMTLRGGRIDTLVFDGHTFPVNMGIRIYSPEWKDSTTNDPWNTTRLRYWDSAKQNREEWSGHIKLPGTEGTAEYRIRVREGGGSKIGLHISFKPQKTIEMEGAFYEILLPRAIFAGGEVTLSQNRDENPRKIGLPERKGGKELVDYTDAKKIHVTGPQDGLPELVITMGRNNDTNVVVEDASAHGAEGYLVRIPILQGDFRHSRGSGLSMSIQGKPAPLETVDLEVDTGKSLYDFKGFGGNYCFEIDTPHTSFTLQNLQPKVARVEMSLKEWEPENDNASAVATDLRGLEEHDQPDTKLHNELQLASQLQAQGIPLVASVWELPRWLYVDEGEQRKRHGPVFGKVDMRLLDEVGECVGSYLSYALWKYAVEPEYISFNEPDIGVRVKMTPRGHRRVLVAVAEDLQRRKLKTKVLVGDVANMRDSIDYVEDILDDRKVRRHAGAIGIHSWLGAPPEPLRKWRKLADKYELPLLVTEMGFDPSAHHHRQWMMHFNYGMREAELQQQLLRDAQPQGSYYWQFTKDYSLLKEEKISTTQTQLVPTERYNFMGHLTMLTPGESAGLSTQSSDPDIVWISAFKGPRAAESQTLTIHILNTSGERTANLDGLGTIKVKGQKFVSEQDKTPEVSEIAAPAGGKMELLLPPRSLTTLVFSGMR
ncbi:MAG: hypothetical protein ACOCVL_01440 [Candidatus Sumerlaeota bacterium]